METLALERRILEELVYERLRAAVDLCSIFELEQDLERSTDRAAVGHDGTIPAALDFIVRAWTRVGQELLAELSPTR